MRPRRPAVILPPISVTGTVHVDLVATPPAERRAEVAGLVLLPPGSRLQLHVGDLLTLDVEGGTQFLADAVEQQSLSVDVHGTADAVSSWVDGLRDELLLRDPYQRGLGGAS